MNIDKKIKKIIISLATAIVFSFISTASWQAFAMEEEGEAPPQFLQTPSRPFPINWVFLFDDGNEYWSRHYNIPRFGAAMTKALASSIEQKVPIITTPELLSNLVLTKDEWATKTVDQLEIPPGPGAWLVYRLKSEDFVILLPTMYKDRDKEYASIVSVLKNLRSDDALYSIKPTEIRSIFSAFQPRDLETLEEDPGVKVKNLANLFRNTEHPNHIYLSGHGTEEKGRLIVGMTPEQYMELLKILNDANAQFLYVTSCFAGGTNLLHAHDLVTTEHKNRDLSQIDYPIAIGAFTSTQVEGFPRNIQHFFDILAAFMDTTYQRLYLGIPMMRVPGERPVLLKDVLMSIYEQTGGWTASQVLTYPSIHLPHLPGLFRAIALDARTYILTYPRLMAVIIEAKRLNKKPELRLSNIWEQVFVYPSILTSINIRPTVGPGSWDSVKRQWTNIDKLPTFFSRIIGNAQHYVEKIRGIGNLPLSNAYQAFISRLITKDDKAWFINKVFCENDLPDPKSLHEEIVKDMKENDPSLMATQGQPITVEGLVVHELGSNSKPPSLNRVTVVTIACKVISTDQETGEGIVSYHLMVTIPIKPMQYIIQGVPWRQISKEEYARRVKIALYETRPTQAALREATGGHQTVEMVDNAARKFLQKQEIEPTLLTRQQYQDEKVQAAIRDTFPLKNEIVGEDARYMLAFHYLLQILETNDWIRYEEAIAQTIKTLTDMNIQHYFFQQTLPQLQQKFEEARQRQGGK